MTRRDVHAYIDSLGAELIEIRRDFHRHPEVSFDVSRTASKVAELLESYGLAVQRNVGKHFGMGVVGTLHGGKPGKTLLLRADMDALPIEEGTRASYASSQAGKMHACGHDAHTAMLLGAAKALSRYREQLFGTVKFVFQPSEESAKASPIDGRLISGGRDMIEAGILEGVDQCFAFHVWPDLPVGVAGLHRTYAMAASSHFRITFQGLNGHHSTPHLAVDAIAMAAQFITEIKYVMATELNPHELAVLGFGTLNAGSAINAIAGSSELSGTFRAFNPQVVKQIHDALEKRAKAIADSYGGSFVSEYRLGTAVLNEERSVQVAFRAAQVVFGEEQVRILETPSLAGEDFALYLEQVPGAFVFLGVNNPEKGVVHPIHHPLFDIDEDVLTRGARLHVELAYHVLHDDNGRHLK